MLKNIGFLNNYLTLKIECLHNKFLILLPYFQLYHLKETLLTSLKKNEEIFTI
ncbi:hypothetical protein SAMN04488101_10420 [Pedobacter nyackensis]|uniref:Uncharacterized protein n=1 Tax=Pedobacter nyackensis TaxID=475255 RepID=A0A1W2CGK0_9SPHI|nr:hypothetical protein SAMN04488101_10420 [Pedobacter nyackensis]